MSIRKGESREERRIFEEIRAQLDAIEDQVRELEELTTGRMHGEPTYPDVRRYERIYAILTWLKKHCG